MSNTASPGNEHAESLPLDFEGCYRASSGRESRWDGRFYLGVTSTGIYCRPSCPARKPLPENCQFFPSAAACVAAGFRACKRCRPDAVPGTRDWDSRADLVGRAVRSIRDGAIDAVGVSGLAKELSVSERHLHRLLVSEVGASPLQLARTRRAHAARNLIEHTDLPLVDIAFAAGFGSLRQFGETVVQEFGAAPSALRRNLRARHSLLTRHQANRDWPSFTVHLRTRAPFDAAALRASLVAHAIPGRDLISPDLSTIHALDVPGGTAQAAVLWQSVQVSPEHVLVPIRLTLPSLSDTLSAISILRSMLDLDADPAQLHELFGDDERLGPLLHAHPGVRVPGARNVAEFALATVLGQQVSLAAARTLQGRLAATFAMDHPGEISKDLDETGFLARPDVHRIAATDPERLRELIGLTNSKARTVSVLARALAEGVDLSSGADREHTRAALRKLHGIGPWTVEIIAMRALRDPDAYPAGDLILQRALGTSADKATLAIAEPWHPFRSYATHLLWAKFLSEQETSKAPSRP